MKTPSPSKLSPLWIISLFVSFTEGVLGYAVTKTAGVVQDALTSFVILFALGVAAAFFFILWHKPHHFYSPSDFGTMPPKDFVDALHGTPRTTLEQAQRVASNPADATALYQLLDSLLENTFKQHLILMAEKDVQIPYTLIFGDVYKHGSKGKNWSSGMFQPDQFVRKLEGTGFVQLAQNGGPKIQITEKGRAFVDWLVKNGKKDEFFSSSLGTWGTPFTADDMKQPAEAEEVGES